MDSGMLMQAVLVLWMVLWWMLVLSITVATTVPVVALQTASMRSPRPLRLL